MSRPLLVPGETCATLLPDSCGGLLVDGRDFYRAFYDAACQARHTILMAGWQFSSGVELVRGADAECCGYPTRLMDLLVQLCHERPDLHVYMLPWDSSPVFAFEREPLQRLRFTLWGHPRIHWHMDSNHPTWASHHQKLIVVDRAIAFVGGMDICDSRWDDRSHAAIAKDRTYGGRMYAPYHDVQAYVTGDAVDVLRRWFSERWEHASGQPLVLGDCPRHTIQIRPTLEVRAPRVALARTWPRTLVPPHDGIRELLHLHVRAIGSAKNLVYIETQYFSSDAISQALESRMRQDASPPLEIVMVLPARSAGLKERVSIGVYQAQLLEHLTRVAAATGHHLGIYYQVARGGGEELAVFIHAKVLAVDDRFLLVSSANHTNRSMGMDTELGIAWESPAPARSLHTARMELLAEHLGVECSEADVLLGPPEGLVARLDALAAARLYQLRMHPRWSEKPGALLGILLPDAPPFDPRGPEWLREGLLPERGTLLDRLLREPLSLLGTRGRRDRK